MTRDQKIQWKQIKAVLISLLLLFSYSSIFATSYTWSGGTGNWSVSTNWTPNGVPGVGDDVIINTGTVTLDAVTTVLSISLGGGDLVLDNALTVSGDAALTSSSSEISGVADLTISGNLTWDSGKISGSGLFSLTGTLTGSGANPILNTRSLTLTEGGTWTNQTYNLESGASITIPMGKTLTIDNTSSESLDGPTSNGGTLINNGTIEKNGAGTFSITDNELDNNGDININVGSFSFSSRSVSTHDNGTVTIANGATLNFNGSQTTNTFTNTSISNNGTFSVASSTAIVNINTGSTLNNDISLTAGLLILNVAQTFSTLSLTGGDMTLNANLTVTSTVTLDGSGSVIDGNGDITIGGAFTWDSGTITGSGNVTVTGSLTGTSGSSFLETKIMTLNLGGTLTNHSFSLKDNAKFIIPSGQTLTIDNSSTRSFTAASGNFGTIENNGTIEKNGTGVLEVKFNTFDNNGMLNINNGTFYFTTGSSSTHDNSTVTIASGATMQFLANTHDFTNNTIAGDGLFKLLSTAVVNINTGCTFEPATEMAGGTINLNVDASIPSLDMYSSTSDLVLNSNLIVTGDVTLSTSNAEISGSGDLTIDGTLTWASGTVSGTGAFTLNGAFSGISGNNARLDTRTIIFNAGATWTNFELDVYNGASITIPSGQTLTIDNSVNKATNGTPGTPGTIINNGTIIKNGAGEYGINHNTFDNNGTITINERIFSLGSTANSTHDGATITVAAGTEFELSGPSTTHTFDNTAISGDGLFKMYTTSGSVSINTGSSISTNVFAGQSGSSIFTLNVATTIPSLEISNCEVVLNANLTVTGDADLFSSGGTVISGPGNLNINGNLDWGGGTITGSGSFSIGGTLTADGANTILDMNNRSLSLTSGGYFSNLTFSLTNGASLTIPPGQTMTLHWSGIAGSVSGGNIINNGIIEKTGTASYYLQNNDIDNNGAVNVSEGKLYFRRTAGTNSSDHDGATFTIASGSELYFDGGNIIGSSIHDFDNTSITGPGTFYVTKYAEVNWNAGTTVSDIPLVIENGYLDINVDLTLNSLTSSGIDGVLGGAFSTLTVTGDVIWSQSADIAPDNPATVNIGGVFDLNSTGTGTNISNATITPSGGGTWTNSSFTMQNNSEFIVPSGQTVTITNHQSQSLLNGTGSGTLTNNGTLIKSGSHPYTINVPYGTGSGSITDIQEGTLTFNDDFDNGGTVKGIGTLNISGATVNDYGTFAPGSSPGTLTITGDYINETLDIEIVDGMPVEFDQLIVSGAVTLGGTLNLTETGNVPAGSYTIITGSSVSGSFATTNLPDCYTVEVSGGNVNINKGIAKIWDGSNGTWSTASSWLPNGVPCEYDDVVINSGVCDLNVAPEMASLTVNSGGTLAVTDGSAYTIDAPTVIAAGAELRIALGEVILTSSFENNGCVTGGGVIDKTGATIVGGDGCYSPGLSAGTLTVKGTHTNEEIQMEIGGTGGGVVKDLLEVTQTIELGGLFELGYLGGTVPAGTYEMMACSGGPNCVTGTFATVIFPPECQGGCSLEISPAGSEVNLVTTGDIQFTGECTWLGGNGPWNDQTNWSCNDVPNADDDVIIGAGQISLGSPVSMKTCQFTGGEIAGSGNMTVAELLTWAGGTLGANGNHDIASLNITGSCFLSEGTLLLNGTGTWENANLQLSNGSMFKIGAGETLTLNLTTNRQIDGGAGGGTFQNEGGTFVKTGGGDLSVNIPFVSSGNTNLLDGVLNLNDIFNNLGGILHGVAFLDVVDATVEDFGTVSPGTSPGNLTVLGDWLNNTLRYEIEEVSGMVNHDLLHVTQNGTFDGTLEILHLGGTVPYGDYPIVTCGGTCTGAFGPITYPAFCAGECSIAYSGNDAVLHYSMAPLPVELLRFGGHWENGTVQLEWETASEIDHDGFIVERSGDGTVWEGLGFVAGTGSATAGSRYTFTDSNPSVGQNYYRLRMRALDGQDEYSHVVSVGAEGNNWQLYPNPVADELLVTFPNNTNGHLRLFDWTGRQILEEKLDDRPMVRFDMAALPAGAYCLRLDGGAGRVVLKK